MKDKSTDMYTHRQAAWRSAWAVAVSVLPFLMAYLWQMLRSEAASPVLPIIVALAMVGLLSVVLAAAFAVARLSRAGVNAA